MDKHIWPLHVIAETTSHAGKRLAIDAIIEGAGNPKAAMWHYVYSLKRSWEWLGVEITGVTPLGQKVSIVYEEDNNHE